MGQVQLTAVKLTKYIDAASPLLAQALVGSEPIDVPRFPTVGPNSCLFCGLQALLYREYADDPTGLKESDVWDEV